MNGRNGAGAPTGSTLCDPAHERAYLEDGFVVMPLLDRDEVTEIESMYWALVPDGDHGLTVDYLRPDRSYMRRISEMLAPVWERHLPRVFTDHHAIFVTFVVKHPGVASEMFLHEDRSWVDERVFRSGTLWIPMTDVGPGIDNGGLQIVRHSHRLATCWSGTGTPDLIRPYETTLRRHLEPVAVRAGSAVFYDSRTLHASPPNRTDAPRVALACGIAPRDAQLIHVVATGRRHRQIFAVDIDFFIDHGPGEINAGMPPGYRLIEEMDETPALSPGEVGAVTGGPVGAVVADPAPPSDVAELLGSFALQSVPAAAVRRLTPPELDLDLATTGTGALPTIAGLTFHALAGAPLRLLDDDGRPAEIARALSASNGDRPSTVVTLPAGSRLAVEVDVASSAELAFVDGPALTSGVAGATTRNPTEPGDVVALLGGSRNIVWNDGPGAMVVAIVARSSTAPPAATPTRPGPDRRTVARRALHRLRHQVGR